MHYLIAHAPHAPGRKASLVRLREQLPQAVPIPSAGPEHASIWSRRIWECAAAIDDHVCILNDDVILAPDFHPRLTRAVAAQPSEPISLHSSNPNVAAVKGAAWARCYHYSGPGVVLPPGAAADLLAYVYTLPWSLLSRLNEDNVAALWAWERQRPFWYLLPSPLTHDVAVPSTLGYDQHPHRVPVLGPELPERDVTDLTAPFVELDWGTTASLAYRREVLRSGGQLCTFCLVRQGNVGNASTMVCTRCLAQLTATALGQLK
jgi:hypothetical protein